MEQRDTAAVAGTGFPRLPRPDQVEPWDPTTVWKGGFIATAEVRRRQLEPGRAAVWVRVSEMLLDGEEVSRSAAAIGLLDIANGMTVRARPEDVAFPNVDLTAHLVRPPAEGWLGLDTTVTFGANGIGLTSSVVHDERGPIGTSSQCLTVRPFVPTRGTAS
jgi:hypothetical protein